MHAYATCILSVLTLSRLSEIQNEKKNKINSTHVIETEILIRKYLELDVVVVVVVVVVMTTNFHNIENITSEFVLHMTLFII